MRFINSLIIVVYLVSLGIHYTGVFRFSWHLLNTKETVTDNNKTCEDNVDGCIWIEKTAA